MSSCQDYKTLLGGEIGKLFIGMKLLNSREKLNNFLAYAYTIAVIFLIKIVLRSSKTLNKSNLAGAFVILGVLSQSVQDESVLKETRDLTKFKIIINLLSMEMHVHVFVSISQLI